MALVPLDPNQLATTLATAGSIKKEKYRPYHTGENAHEWVPEPDVVADTKKDAKIALRRKTGHHWVRKSPQHKPKGEILGCASHVDCLARAKVVVRPADGKWLLFRTPTEHAAQPVESKRLPPKYVDRVDELLREHHGQPTKVKDLFILSDDYKYPSLEEGNNTDTLPTAAQCKNRARTLRAQGMSLATPDFLTKADTDAYAAQHLMVTKEDILNLPPLQPFILPNGYFWSEKTGAIFVISSLAVIQNVLHEYKANGSTGEIGVKADATFKQEKHGYCTLDVGCDSLVLDDPAKWVKFDDKKKRPHMSYRPFCYVTCKSESKISYQLPLQSISTFAALVWGITLTIKGACGDNMRSLTAAARAVNHEVNTSIVKLLFPYKKPG